MTAWTAPQAIPAAHASAISRCLARTSIGVYQTTNEFGDFFNGAQIYAISKAKLVAAANGGPAADSCLASMLRSNWCRLAASRTRSSQPRHPGQDDWDHDQGGAIKDGAEYFLSALQFVDTFDNRIAVWALTNTEVAQLEIPNPHSFFRRSQFGNLRAAKSGDRRSWRYSAGRIVWRGPGGLEQQR